MIPRYRGQLTRDISNLSADNAKDILSEESEQLVEESPPIVEDIPLDVVEDNPAEDDKDKPTDANNLVRRIALLLILYIQCHFNLFFISSNSFYGRLKESNYYLVLFSYKNLFSTF